MMMQSDIAEALCRPILGAHLPTIALAGSISTIQAIEQAVAQWAPRAEVHSVRLQGGATAILDAPIVKAQIYAMCRGGGHEIVLQLQGQAGTVDSFAATAYVRLPSLQ